MIFPVNAEYLYSLLSIAHLNQSIRPKYALPPSQKSQYSGLVPRPLQEQNRLTIVSLTYLVELSVFDVFQLSEFARPCSIRKLPRSVCGTAI